MVCTYNGILCNPEKKNKEILSYTTTWINLRDIMLSELSLLQKEKQCVSK